MNGDTPAESNARHHARRCGLRLAKRGGVIELRDGDTTVCRGDVDDIEAYIATKHPRRRPGGQPKPEYAVPPAWAQIIDEYMLSLAAAGQPAASLTLRRIQLVRMARDLGGQPTDVTADPLVGWFGAQTGWKTETRRNYRAAVRGFWRWAYRTKRVPHHLADELPKVRERWGVPSPHARPLGERWRRPAGRGRQGVQGTHRADQRLTRRGDLTRCRRPHSRRARERLAVPRRHRWAPVTAVGGATGGASTARRLDDTHFAPPF
jgi:hypothetical protein